MHIYLITNTVNGKIYVGQTCQALSRYMRDNLIRAIGHNDSRKPHLYNAFRRYGEESFTIETLIYIDLEDKTWKKSLADNLERYYIKTLKSQDSTIGYNIASGGSGSYGYARVISAEHREKIRIAGTGRKHSEETKLKMKVYSSGRPKSEEHKKNLSIARMGKKRGPFSQDHKDKMAAAGKAWYASNSISQERRDKQSASMKAFYEKKKLMKVEETLCQC